MGAVCIVALVLSAGSFAVAIASWLRAGGRQQLAAMRRDLAREVELLRTGQQTLLEDLATRVRRGYERLLARVEHAQQRLGELRERASADMHRRLDTLREELADVQGTAAGELARLKAEASAATAAAEDSLARRLRRLEGRLQILQARMEISNAEVLAGDGDFTTAEELLEDAVARVRDVRSRLDEMEEDPAFGDVLNALQKAIRSVRMRAEARERQIDRVVSASDTLLACLEAREQSLA